MEESQAIDFLSTLIPFTMVVFIIAVGVVLLNQQFRKNLLKQQLEQEALKAKYQREILQTSIQVQEDERKRIAQDLHDQLGAALSISRMQLVQLEQRTKSADPDLEQSVSTVRKTLENALTATRRISHELMPVQLSDLGLITALDSILNKATQAGDWQVEFDAPEAIESLQWPIKVGLYRICAELVNNSLKYAQAKRIRLILDVVDDQLICNYSDDGKGVDLETATKGIGLKSIEGRAMALGGKIIFNSAPFKGFSMELGIPLELKPDLRSNG